MSKLVLYRGGPRDRDLSLEDEPTVACHVDLICMTLDGDLASILQQPQDEALPVPVIMHRYKFRGEVSIGAPAIRAVEYVYAGAERR